MNEIKVMTDFNHFFFFSYFNSIHFFVLQSMNSKREREREMMIVYQKRLIS